ncbi:MAG: 16S rRNA (cytidine(1402)-2'-O)-methyltransferase [Clostridiaceae bacterium]|nr:16S rRNA (cytidine(1402)-2'-O)-methyltransferase [Clostridiaceae bacterium]
MSGKLYVVATPIGNLSDFSPRAIETLQHVDFIAAEDTRVGVKLLNKFDIHTPQISYFEHNRRQKGEQIAARLQAGENCALITDAGTPAISDPGTDLVALCAAEGIEVVAVPGCCAAATALSVSGMECGRFTFEGFLSTAPKSRREHLASVKEEPRTMVFYEAPHKLLRTLSDMLESWGDRELALCRELTKLHEEVRRTTLSEAVRFYSENPPRGEFVLVIAGCGQKAEDAQPPDLLAEVRALVDDGASLRDAVQQVSRTHSVPKNRLYQQALESFGRK